jgi:RNA polymerase sigma factor (TIGR02999 family)
MATRLVGLPNGTPTLGATALINEGYSRLIESSDLVGIETAEHFYRRFAVCMKHALIDHARAKLAEKRGGKFLRLDLESVLQKNAMSTEQLLQLNEAINLLKCEDSRASDFIEMRYFAQMTILEISKITGLSTATIDRTLRFGRAFLRSKINEDSD